MKGKAAVFMGANTPFEVEQFEVVAPSPGYARSRLIASGVCGTDIHIHTGRLGCNCPQIIGHEFVGEVEAIGEADSAAYGIVKGDNVIVDIAIPCGECALCKAGDDANCVNMQVSNGGNPAKSPYFHGGYGEYNFSPVSNLIKLPKSVNPLAAAVFACPGPTAIHAFNLAKKGGFDSASAKVAVVQGTGAVGSFALAYLSSLKVEHIIALTVVDREEQVTLARKLGATEVIDIRETSQEEILARVHELSGSLGADLVFEASGNPNAVPMGMNLLRNRGVYLVPGQYSNSGAVEIQPQLITFKALHIIGSSQYSICDVKEYVKFLEKTPELSDTILSLATCYNIADVNKAFTDAKARKNIKTVLTGDIKR